MKIILNLFLLGLIGLTDITFAYTYKISVKNNTRSPVTFQISGTVHSDPNNMNPIPSDKNAKFPQTFYPFYTQPYSGNITFIMQNNDTCVIHVDLQNRIGSSLRTGIKQNTPNSSPYKCFKIDNTHFSLELNLNPTKQ